MVILAPVSIRKIVGYCCRLPFHFFPSFLFVQNAGVDRLAQGGNGLDGRLNDGSVCLQRFWACVQAGESYGDGQKGRGEGSVGMGYQ